MRWWMSFGRSVRRQVGGWSEASSAGFCKRLERRRTLAWRTGQAASRAQQAAYFRGLRLGDLVLARACAAGNERAWERFVAIYREPLTRAAIAITGNETLGRELADQLYAELYGLTTRDGERRCPLESYRGRGSLMGWLRTTLAQRHVDHYRRRHREEPLEEFEIPAAEAEMRRASAELTVLEKAVEVALKGCEAEERLLLAAYYLDGRTLLQIARVLACARGDGEPEAEAGVRGDTQAGGEESGECGHEQARGG